MEKVFNLKEKSLVIYGAAAIGLIVYDICQESGLSVAAFIDQRGDEIQEIHEVKVYSMDSTQIEEIDKECPVFVAVKNVFEHDNIVRKLIEKGFTNIIYRPSIVIKGKGNEDEKVLNEIYDKFMEKEVNYNDIPKTFKVHQYEYRDYATVKNLGEERIVYIPMEYLFTDKKAAPKWGWVDIPVMALIPHIAFFKWMDGQEGFSYDMYLKFCINSTKIKGQIKVTERWKENVIRNRANVYANMNESLERDFDFFIRNAPRATWNEGGYFNLVSGKHRAAFWIAKGRRYIPLKISNSDFQKWIHEVEVNRIIAFFRENDVIKIKAPVEHAYFYDMPCENKDFYFQLLKNLIYMMALDQYEQRGYVKLKELLPVFISLDDDGYMSRTLQRYEITVETHNRSKTGVMLQQLLTIKRETKGAKEYSWALVEFDYGKEIKFPDIVTKKIKNMICLVPVEKVGEFESIIDAAYSVANKRLMLKDGKSVYSYRIGQKA